MDEQKGIKVKLGEMMIRDERKYQKGEELTISEGEFKSWKIAEVKFTVVHEAEKEPAKKEKETSGKNTKEG